MKLLRDPIFLLLLGGLLAWLVYLGMQPPRALPANIPNTGFSAERAMQRLQQLLPENRPHPAGSAQNRLVRDRIQEQLAALGLNVEFQQLRHCVTRFGVCGPVENILARVPGTGGGPGHALLLTAHYDSVDAGPGAADDGAGVAVLLETVAMAMAQGGFRHDLILLVSDAEEQGLVGADAFASRHPWFADVSVVINVEARGVTGSSTMFETGIGNRSFIRILAQALDRPVANSITREVYRRMPNDTDFSVYRDLERSGFNFAFTGGAAVYHSAVDDLQHLDAGSLQHHGQNVWALLQVLNQRDLQRIDTDEDAVYVDLFGHKLLHFPASSATGLALVLSVLMLVFVRISFRHQLSLRQSAWTLLYIIALLPLLLAMAWLVSWPLGVWPDLNRMGHPHPWLGRLALVLLVLLALRLLHNSLNQRAATGSVTLVCWLFFAALAMLLSYRLPAASFLGILPLVAFSLGAILDGVFRKRHTQLLFARLLGFAAATYLGFYFFYGLEVVAGFDLAYLQIVPLLLPAIAVLPLLVTNAFSSRSSRAGLLWLLLPIVAICIAQQFLPGHTIDRPRGMNLVHRANAGQDAAYWQLETASSKPDKGYARRHEFGPVELDVPGREMQPIIARPAQPLGLDPVQLLRTSQRDDGTLLRRTFSLGVPNGVRQLALFLPEQLEYNSIRVDGALVLQRESDHPDRPVRNAIAIYRPDAGELVVEISSPSGPSSAPGDTERVVEFPIRTRFDLPHGVPEEFLSGWPLDAQPQHHGHRAEVDSLLEVKF